MKKLELPSELERYRKEIEETIKPVIRITGRKGKTLLNESKFGGDPYLPIGKELPKNDKGEYLKLLAQINLEEIPYIDPFPKKGILQFFIDTDDIMGLDQYNGYKVVYYEEILDSSCIVKDFTNFITDDEINFPFDEEIKLIFELDSEQVSWFDYQREKLLDNHIDFDEKINKGDKMDYFDVFLDHFNDCGDGHKIGGYAYFTQSDPRSNIEGEEGYDILLLQLDTDVDLGIEWVDSGVGNFFIRESDLKKLDFSNVLYNWDCC